MYIVLYSLYQPVYKFFACPFSVKWLVKIWGLTSLSVTSGRDLDIAFCFFWLDFKATFLFCRHSMGKWFSFPQIKQWVLLSSPYVLHDEHFGGSLFLDHRNQVMFGNGNWLLVFMADIFQTFSLIRNLCFQCFIAFRNVRWDFSTVVLLTWARCANFGWRFRLLSFLIRLFSVETALFTCETSSSFDILRTISASVFKWR